MENEYIFGINTDELADQIVQLSEEIRSGDLNVKNVTTTIKDVATDWQTVELCLLFNRKKERE